MASYGIRAEGCINGLELKGNPAHKATFINQFKSKAARTKKKLAADISSRLF